MSELEQATAVHRRDDGVYDAEIAAGWDIGGNANGGYLMALAARAMADAVGRPPLSLTGHFLAPGKVGPVEIEVEVVRAGRRMAVVRATVRSGRGPVMTLLGTFAEQPDGDGGPRVVAGAPPELPPIDECVPGRPPVETGDSGFGDRMLTRYHPDDIGFATGRPSGRALVRGYCQFADGAPVDALGLIVVADAMAPVCFNRAEFPVSWAPTLELTVHVRDRPAPGPLRASFSSRFIQHGMFEEDGELWDSRGVLVAQSRQLALIPLHE